MNGIDKIHLARAVAMAAHAGQTDKAGEPYFRHCHRVARRVMIETDNFDVIAAAYLHDVVEDTPMTVADLDEIGFSVTTQKLVSMMTHEEGESYEEYVRRVAAQDLPRIIKKADISDNSDPARLKRLDQATQDRLLKKYGRAFAIISEYEREDDDDDDEVEG